MFSMPPTTTTSASPVMICCAPSCTAFIPEAHAMFTLYAGTSMGMPAFTETWRPVFGPFPAWRACDREATPGQTRSDGGDLVGPFARARELDRHGNAVSHQRAVTELDPV